MRNFAQHIRKFESWGSNFLILFAYDHLIDVLGSDPKLVGELAGLHFACLHFAPQSPNCEAGKFGGIV